MTDFNLAVYIDDQTLKNIVDVDQVYVSWCSLKNALLYLTAECILTKTGFVLKHFVICNFFFFLFKSFVIEVVLNEKKMRYSFKTTMPFIYIAKAHICFTSLATPIFKINALH